MSSDGERNKDDDARRCRLLEAALGVFGRYGFRKTSMEEIARAAGLSRQAVYLRFSTKETLFSAAVEHTLTTSLREATASLSDPARPLEARLVGAFDAWVGRFVGVIGAEAIDLTETASALLGPVVAGYEERFLEAVVRAIRGAGLVAACHLPGLTARQLATTFHATATGLKHRHQSRPAFVDDLTLAARVLCAPLREKI